MTTAVAWPDTSKAQLPQTYEHAKGALAECTKIDECKTWADKAAALASYAKQANDDELRKMAERIQARAIRRCAELLQQIDDARGGDRTKSKGSLTFAPTGKGEAAREAGLSLHQQRTAMRVGRIPSEEFNAAIESADPPTITELAERGTQKRTPVVDIGDTNPLDFKAATTALGELRNFVAEAVTLKPIAVARGLHGHEPASALSLLRKIIAWCEDLQTCIENERGN